MAIARKVDRGEGGGDTLGMNTAFQPAGPTGKPSSDDWSDDRLDLSADQVGRHAGWGIVAVLAGVCLVLRVTRLTSLSIFGDEGIYLRWTQLIRLDPWGNAFISLDDPKPPLHYWLMAIFYRISRDPLWSGRFVSVMVGVATIFALAGACREMQRSLVEQRDGDSVPTSKTWVPIVLLLTIFCPYLAFYQRMALAESLFVFEMCVIVWISLRWVRAIQNDAGPAQIVVLTTLLGIAFGITFLSRQSMSYLLVGMVPIAWILVARRPSGPVWKDALVRRAGWATALLAGALLLAGILWSPFLLERSDLYRYRPLDMELSRRIWYQEAFAESMPFGARVGLVEDNLLRAFVPWNLARHTWQIDAGWFWVNLSPGIFLLVLVAAAWLVWRRQHRLFAFLLLWTLLLLGPMIVFATVPRGRYVLPACIPMLVGVGYFVADQATRFFEGGRKQQTATFWLGMTGVALLFAAYQVGLQLFSPYHIFAIDAEYFTQRNSWTDGRATESTIAALRRDIPPNGVVITSNAWGANDALWVYLDPRDPGNTLSDGVIRAARSGSAAPRMYYLDQHLDRPILRRGVDDRFLLKGDKWLYLPERPVTITPDEPIYFVCPVTSADDREPALRHWNQIVGSGMRFDNPPNKDGSTEGFEIFRLEAPPLRAAVH